MNFKLQPILAKGDFFHTTKFPPQVSPWNPPYLVWLSPLIIDTLIAYKWSTQMTFNSPLAWSTQMTYPRSHRSSNRMQGYIRKSNECLSCSRCSRCSRCDGEEYDHSNFSLNPPRQLPQTSHCRQTFAVQTAKSISQNAWVIPRLIRSLLCLTSLVRISE
jgi:hypothetical protein